jgi:hypothetical protein
MIWLTWRLQRTEYLLLGLMLLALSGLLLQTHGDVVKQYEAMASAGCSAGTEGFVRPCQMEIPVVGKAYQFVNTALPWFNFLPLIAALLMALPIVTEFEGGTYRLAWTQGVSRQQWARTKIGLLTLSGMAFAAVFALTFGWWSAPIDRLQGRLGSDTYDFHGTLPIGHTLFAIGLMLAVGVILRRTVPAIFLASVLYLGARIPFMIWARPHLVSPLTRTVGLNSRPPSMGEWGLSSHLIDAAGNRVSERRLFEEICPPATFGLDRNTMSGCITKNGLSQVETYHPASHYWPLQLIETGIFLAAGIALIAFAAWYLLRRVE